MHDEHRQEDLNSKLFLNFRKSSLLLFILYKIYIVLSNNIMIWYINKISYSVIFEFNWAIFLEKTDFVQNWRFLTD